MKIGVEGPEYSEFYINGLTCGVRRGNFDTAISTVLYLLLPFSTRYDSWAVGEGLMLP